MKRPEWCPHEECLFKLKSQNAMCVGKLPNPEPHDDDFNTHRLCIDTRETDHGVFDLQVHRSDCWNLIRILKEVLK